MISESCEETDPNIEYPFINEVKTEIRIGEYTYIDDETWEVKTVTGNVRVADVRRPDHFYEWIGIPDVTDNPEGLPGQGIQNPYSDFGVYYVTFVNGRIYDSSYGKNYMDIKSWEEDSIDAFYKFTELEGSSEERFIYKIRKNTSQDEIID